jgi:hypothetical protein
MYTSGKEKHMITHETEIWSENDNYMMWVSIDFDYLPPEYDGNHCYVMGEFVIHDVHLLEIEGYGVNGNIVYNYQRRSIDPYWLEILDSKLYDIVDGEAEGWSRLAHELVEAAV